MDEWGVWDFVGDIVLQATAGFWTLAAILMMGKREAAEGEDLDEPHLVRLCGMDVMAPMATSS